MSNLKTIFGEFEVSLPSKKQLIDIVKVALYIGVSAALDYLISVTAGSNLGTFTLQINFLLVTIKKFITKG